MVGVWSLAQEILHAMSTAKKQKTNNHPLPQIAGSYSQYFWLNRPGMEAKNLHFYHIPRWWWHCWFQDHTLRTFELMCLKAHDRAWIWNVLAQSKWGMVSQCWKYSLTVVKAGSCSSTVTPGPGTSPCHPPPHATPPPPPPPPQPQPPPPLRTMTF